MENEDKRYYVRQYERAYTNSKRDKIVREARAKVIEKYIELLKTNSTWFVMAGIPARLCGKDAKEIRGWLGRLKAIKEFEKELKKNETETWDHIKQKSLVYNTLIIGSSFLEDGYFII